MNCPNCDSKKVFIQDNPKTANRPIKLQKMNFRDDAEYVDCYVNIKKCKCLDCSQYFETTWQD